jgi:hypothetical protein
VTSTDRDSNVLNEDSQGRSRKPTSLPGLPLARAGQVLLAVFTCWTLLVVLPLDINNPIWLHRFSSTLTDNSLLVILGISLIHAAAILKPADNRIRDIRTALSGLLVPVVSGYLLLIPLDYFATSKQAGLLQREYRKKVAELEQIRDQAIALVDQSPDLNSLEASLRRLSMPTLNREGRALPLPLIKQQVRRTLEQSMETTKADVAKSLGEASRSLIKERLRVLLTAFLMAMGLAWLSYDEAKRMNLVEKIFKFFPTNYQRLSRQLSSKRSRSRRSGRG